ncbi:hypothetical protein BDQ17DRAFT_1248761 [Cyathus striatus]|nr:hypothetical protein BDQ17DRAFT_1248761 [Cyathus striatus]
MPLKEKLFQPVEVGRLELQHRIVLAPLTRFKSFKNHVPNVPLMKEYYSQRSTTPGTLVIAEGTSVAAKAGGFPNGPGLWSAEQTAAWKEIVDAVHANGSFIFVQIFAHGRAVFPSLLEEESFTLVGPSPIPLSNEPTLVPKELTREEIHEYVDLFTQAAKDAVYEAGFDGVEVHIGNGYLLDQFIQDTSNQRNDEYGGSVANRSRFPLEVVASVASAVGPERTGVRLSPWSPFQDMKMKDPIPQFKHFVSELKASHPELAYLHVIEPRISGASDIDGEFGESESNDFIQEIWYPNRFISAGGFTRNTAIQHAEKNGDLIAFGRHYIANPDLPRRFAEDKPLNKYNRSTFGSPGDSLSAKGYTDYPALD